MPEECDSMKQVPVVASTVRKTEVWREAERENAPYVAVEEGEKGYMPVYDMLTSHYRLTDEATKELAELFRAWRRDCSSVYVLSVGQTRGSIISLELSRAVSVASKAWEIIQDEQYLEEQYIE